MAISNRDLDPSQQKDVFYRNSDAAIATGVSVMLGVVPYPCSIQSARSVAFGVSNAMQVAFVAMRFTSGGQTTIGLGISNMILNNFGTSGSLGYSGLAAAGSTLLNLQAGDLLVAQTSVANGNATSLALELVLKKVQDIVSHNGVAT